MELGINTYGISKLLHGGFEAVLDKLHSFDYTFLEPCIVFDKSTFILKRTLAHTNLRLWKLDGGIWHSSTNAKHRVEQARAAGFKIVSAQSTFDVGLFLSERLDDALSFLRETNIRYLIVSPMKKAYEEARELIPLLNNASERLQKEGFTLVLHNHEHECMPQATGDTLLEFYLENVPSLQLELDVGWVQYVGGNCIEILRHFRDRLVLLHLKDIQDGVAKAHCFTAIGDGDIPLAEILKEAAKCPKLDAHGIIIDQDKSEHDLLFDLQKGAIAVKKLSDFRCEKTHTL